MKKVIIAYIPVLHKGYLDLFRKDSEADSIYVLGDELLKEFGYLGKEIRALTPGQITKAIKGWGLFKDSNIQIAHPDSLAEIKKCNFTIIMPDEDISHKLADKYLQGCNIEFSTIFLRWDEKSVKSLVLVNFDRESNCQADISFMELARFEGLRSSDWWRRVGAVFVKDGKVISQLHNQHLPSDQTPYIDGDPRDFIKAGECSELCTAIHAEQGLIAKAAREGVSLLGMDIYVTVFPCPVCAKLIALSGIKRCFFFSGHASLDGGKTLKSAGVELIFVNYSPL